MEKHLQRNCQMEGLDRLGLNREEQKMLKILSLQNNKPIRLGSIAMSMGTLPRNISQTIEPYLFKSGLITKTDKGRIITPKGNEHIKNNSI